MPNTIASQFAPDWYKPDEEINLYNQGYLPVRKGWNDMVIQSGFHWGRDNRIPSAYETQPGSGNALIIVDSNIDFVLPNGNLAVPGAMDDMRRIVDWMYRNVANIDHIVASIDAHLPVQIFHPAFWRDTATGGIPDPMQMVNASNFNTKFVPIYSPDWDDDWAAHYIAELAKTSRTVYGPDNRPIKLAKAHKDLMIWTTHCLIGSHQQALVPMVMDAMNFWTGCRGKNWIPLEKGTNEWTEWYSIMEAEVAIPSDPFTQINAQILDALLNYRNIYVVGWAKSHCVFETIQSLVWYLKSRAPHLLKNLHLVMDGMSSVGPVYAPDGTLIVDFEAMVAPQYASWAKVEGLQLVKTTDNGGYMKAA